jgi:TIR domain
MKLFCSYSHKDEALRDELAKHLKLFERQGLIQSWHDRKIGAGDLWQEAIDRGLREADVILLLISADFLASDYCFDFEMNKALDRHAAGEALVIPVILRPVDWRGTPFSKFQALPADGRPVTTFENLDIALEQVAQGIRRAIEGLREKRQAPARRAAQENATPPQGAASFPPLPAARLDQIAKLLALYIGPIASVVVRQAASRCPGVTELCDAVAHEIANPQDRSRFLSEARRVNSSTVAS